jgi:Na+/glutamate symporter
VGNCSFAGFGTGNSTSITIKYVNDDESCGIGISNDAHNTVGLIVAFLIIFLITTKLFRKNKRNSKINYDLYKSNFNFINKLNIK